MLAEEHGGPHTLSVYIGLKFLVVPIGKQDEKIKENVNNLKVKSRGTLGMT